MKSRGPRTEPWRTPHTQAHEEKVICDNYLNKTKCINREVDTQKEHEKTETERGEGEREKGRETESVIQLMECIKPSFAQKTGDLHTRLFINSLR